MVGVAPHVRRSSDVDSGPGGDVRMRAMLSGVRVRPYRVRGHGGCLSIMMGESSSTSWVASLQSQGLPQQSDLHSLSAELQTYFAHEVIGWARALMTSFPMSLTLPFLFPTLSP